MKKFSHEDTVISIIANLEKFRKESQEVAHRIKASPAYQEWDNGGKRYRVVFDRNKRSREVYNAMGPAERDDYLAHRRTLYQDIDPLQKEKRSSHRGEKKVARQQEIAKQLSAEDGATRTLPMYIEAILKVLREERRLMTATEIVKVALSRGLLQISNQSPQRTVVSTLTNPIYSSTFVSPKMRGLEYLFGLVEWSKDISLADLLIPSKPEPATSKYREAAVKVLRERCCLMSAVDITKVAIETGILSNTSKTPEVGMRAILADPVYSHAFVSPKKRGVENLFGLAEWENDPVKANYLTITSPKQSLRKSPLKDAAIQVLREKGCSMSAIEITNAATERRLIEKVGETSMFNMLKKPINASVFVSRKEKNNKVFFGLVEWANDNTNAYPNAEAGVKRQKVQTDVA